MRAEHSWGSVRVKCNEVWTSVRCLNNAGHSGAHVPGWHLQWLTPLTPLTALSICFMLISPCLSLAYLAEAPGLPHQFDSLHIILYWERGSVIFEKLPRWIRSVTLPLLPFNECRYLGLVFLLLIIKYLCRIIYLDFLYVLIWERDDISMYSFTFRYKETHFIAWIVTVSKRHDGETFPNQKYSNSFYVNRKIQSTSIF